jgi:hypothetical protein
MYMGPSSGSKGVMTLRPSPSSVIIIFFKSTIVELLKA